MQTLTLGISPCPNDVFIFSGVLLDKIDTHGLRFDVDFLDIENLNQRANDAVPDAVKISYANYIHCAAHYELLDCGGALGRGVGPLLLVNEGKRKKEKGESKGGAAFSFPLSPFSSPILAPGAYTTANFLLDFYANRDGDRPLHKRFLPFDTLYEELCATPGAQGVVIHEKRFTYEQDGLTLIQDLGEHWEQQTGYAIPLGAICVRRSLGLAPILADIIKRSLQWAYANYNDAFALCRQYAQDLSAGVAEAHIKLYVNNYSEELGPDGEAAVNFFLDKQKQILGQH